MLESLRQGQRWIIWFIVLVVGGVFVLFIGLGAPLQLGGTGSAVVTVGDRQFGPRAISRERLQLEDRYRETLGDAFDARAAGDQLDQVAANIVASRAVRAGEAEALGLRVTEEEILSYVKTVGAFKDEDGLFRGDWVKNYAEREYGAERTFIDFIRMQLLSQKFVRLVTSSAPVTRAEAEDAILYRSETVELAYVAIEGSKAPANLEIAEEEVQALLETEEGRARELYEERLEDFNVSEKVHARHILVRVAPDASDEDVATARTKIEVARARVEKGEDFADVAAEVSDDPGSKEMGGDLGFFERGRMVKPFEEVAFSLEPGVLSDPVRSDFGFHVIRVEEKQAEQSRSFEEVREELARSVLEQDAAREFARSIADRIAARVSDGNSLVDAAREEQIDIERTDPLPRSPTGYVPGLGVAPDVLTAAFGLTAGESSPRIFPVEDKWVLVQVLGRTDPDAAEVESQIEETRERLAAVRRTELEQAWIEQARATLEDEGRIGFNLALLREGSAPPRR